MTATGSHIARLASAVWSLLILCIPVVAQETRPASEVGLAGVPPETPVLVLPSDPTAEPVEPLTAATTGGRLDSGRSRRPARIGAE
jgi:hypothetical protein